jgi:hypothetical protein
VVVLEFLRLNLGRIELISMYEPLKILKLLKYYTLIFRVALRLRLGKGSSSSSGSCSSSDPDCWVIVRQLGSLLDEAGQVY